MTSKDMIPSTRWFMTTARNMVMMMITQMISCRIFSSFTEAPSQDVRISEAENTASICCRQPVMYTTEMSSSQLRTAEKLTNRYPKVSLRKNPQIQTDRQQLLNPAPRWIILQQAEHF